MPATTPRLTELAHGGGCGCKLAPAVLQSLLANQPSAGPFAQLLVGAETSDDAAVWQVDKDLAVMATTDFFMPVVDDPRDFGYRRHFDPSLLTSSLLTEHTPLSRSRFAADRVTLRMET